MIVNATIFSQVVDVRLALFTNSDYLVSVDNLARTSVRAVFGSISLDEAFSQRERIGTLLQTQMEEATDKWGVRINRVEVLEITPPDQILQAMALQKQADQEKRARILESEGQQQSAVNVADGQRPVSYTHLDVYKRQLELHTNETTLFEHEACGRVVDEDLDSLFFRVVELPRRRLEERPRSPRHDLDVAAAESARRSTAVHRGIANADDQHSFADLTHVPEGHRLEPCLLYTSRCV